MLRNIPVGRCKRHHVYKFYFEGLGQAEGMLCPLCRRCFSRFAEVPNRALKPGELQRAFGMPHVEEGSAALYRDHASYIASLANAATLEIVGR